MSLAPSRTRLSSCIAILAIVGPLSAQARAGVHHGSSINVNNHVTDGSFGQNEWNGPHVAKSVFAVVGDSGGASLYVEQTDTTLYLMYDYTNSPAGGFLTGSSLFQIFFQVPPDGNDYLVRIGAGGIVDTYEKPIGSISGLNGDGSFNVKDPVWTALTAGDLALARFRGAIGSDTSADSSAPHLIAEFELSIDRGPVGGAGGDHPSGLYSPDPSFWSAAVKSTDPNLTDPPISSEVFQLMPDGSTLATPVFAANGAPALQPQNVATPEPSTVLGGAIALISAIVVARRRRRA